MCYFKKKEHRLKVARTFVSFLNKIHLKFNFSIRMSQVLNLHHPLASEAIKRSRSITLYIYLHYLQMFRSTCKVAEP